MIMICFRSMGGDYESNEKFLEETNHAKIFHIQQLIRINK